MTGLQDTRLVSVSGQYRNNLNMVSASRELLIAFHTYAVDYYLRVILISTFAVNLYRSIGFRETTSPSGNLPSTRARYSFLVGPVRNFSARCVAASHPFNSSLHLQSFFSLVCRLGCFINYTLQKKKDAIPVRTPHGCI